MKYLYRQTLDFLLFSNVFIALCAVAQGLVTYQLLHAKPNMYVLSLLFCATLAMYNYSILLSKPKNPENSRYRRVRWIFSHYRLIIFITAAAILGIFPLLFFLSPVSIVFLFFLAFISISYNLPVFTLKGRKFSLRNIPGIKLFLIALIWALSCVLLPILQLKSQSFNVSTLDTLLLIAKRFLFVAAITVPFDIRDLYQDRTYELKTIPVVFGEKNAYLFCQFLLLLYLALLFIFNKGFDLNYLGLAVVTLLTGWLIFKSNWERNEYYYFFYLDGTLMLQCVSVYMMQTLF